MATMASVAISSRQASISSFSVKGSPTWTVGRFSSDFSSNSAEAMVKTPKPEITITLQRVEDAGQTPGVVIIFKDNGPGMVPEMLDKMFSPFSTTKARGLGLGLPIARRTILDHNGAITVHSNEFGVLVTIRFPVIAGQARDFP